MCLREPLGTQAPEASLPRMFCVREVVLAWVYIASWSVWLAGIVIRCDGFCCCNSLEWMLALLASVCDQVRF